MNAEKGTITDSRMATKNEKDKCEKAYTPKPDQNVVSLRWDCLLSITNIKGSDPRKAPTMGRLNCQNKQGNEWLEMNTEPPNSSTEAVLR